MTDAPELLWQPDPTASNGMVRFRDWLRAERDVDLAGYDELWQWSVTELAAFWDAVASYTGVRFHAPASQVLGSTAMPGAQWFPGATLNYAEQALSHGEDDDPALVFHREDG